MFFMRVLWVYNEALDMLKKTNKTGGENMLTFFTGLGLNGILILVFGVFVVVFIFKKLFKLAITIAVIAALIHYGLPILQTSFSKM